MTATAAPAPAPGTSRAARLAGRTLPPAIALAVILAVWEAAVRVSDVDPTLFAPPSLVLGRIPDVVTSELFAESVRTTVSLLAIGFVIAATIGILLGIVLGRAKLLDRALTPWVNGLYAAPLPAIIPLLTAAFGFRTTVKIVIVVLLGVFPILINTYQGVTETEAELIEVGQSFRASELQVWGNIVIPFALPYILVGLRLGVVRCLIGTVVAEFYTSPGGLGYMITVFARRFDMPSMLVPVLTLTLLGLVLVGLVSLAERKLTPWLDR